MKRPLFVAFGLSLLVAAPALACEADHTAAMLSQIEKSSAPSNVRASSLQQKAQYCEQSAKNLGLSGSDRASYLGDCIGKNPAQEARTALTGRI